VTSHVPRRPTVGAIGMLAWDRIMVVDTYPEPGDYRVVRQSIEQSGGTTGNIAVALSHLGVDVALAASVGDDEIGERLRGDLTREGCDIEHVHARPSEPTDGAVIIVSGRGATADRTIYWQQGARLKHGDVLPIDEFFARDLVVIDIDDHRLRRLLVDLPMHVSPRTRLLGTLTYLVETTPAEGLAHALRHDVLTGNERELCYISERDSLGEAIARLQQEMVVEQVRFAAISRGASGCVIVSRDSAVQIPAFEVEARDPTGAGDAFAAGVAFGVLNRWEFEQIGRFANAMGALATREIGARASLPDLAGTEQFLSSARARTEGASWSEP
jgi:sugar/nucleoside kinase (ribokinase family)